MSLALVILLSDTKNGQTFLSFITTIITQASWKRADLKEGARKWTEGLDQDLVWDTKGKLLESQKSHITSKTLSSEL